MAAQSPLSSLRPLTSAATPGDNGWIVFQRSGSGRLGLSPGAIGKMSPYAQKVARSKEAGGVLLGRRIIDSDDVVVDTVTVPCSRDVRRRCLFIRHSHGHQAAVDAAWRKSGGSRIYLGEWHTHPEGVPTPSCTDLESWREKMSLIDSVNDSLFFLILGTDELAAWEGATSTLHCDPITS